MKKTTSCPFCGEVLVDREDKPHKGEIVEAARKKNAVIDGVLGKDKNTKIINEASEEFAQALEAEIENRDIVIQVLGEKIEGVRERIKAIQETRRIDKKERRRVQSKLDQVLAEQEKQREKILEYHDSLLAAKTRIGVMESEHLDHLRDEHKVKVADWPKPQPAESPVEDFEQSRRERSRTAQAPDKDGKMHDLIPRVSVIQGRAIATAVFCKDKGEGLLRVRWLNTGLYGAFFLSQTTWLFDLDFPTGGDK